MTTAIDDDDTLMGRNKAVSILTLQNSLSSFENSVGKSDSAGLTFGELSQNEFSDFELRAIEGHKFQGRTLYAKAIDEYAGAINIGQAGYQLMGFVLGNMITCFMALNQWEKSSTFCKKYLNLAIEKNDITTQGRVLSNLGISYYALKQFTTAIETHERALTCAKKSQDAKGELRAFANIGNTYGSMGKFDDAIGYHAMQLRIAQVA